MYHVYIYHDYIHCAYIYHDYIHCAYIYHDGKLILGSRRIVELYNYPYLLPDLKDYVCAAAPNHRDESINTLWH